MNAYVKQIENGKFEYGHVQINSHNRRKDAMVAEGVANNYEAACAAVGITPKSLITPPATDH